ncbi:hypothetical protein SAMN04487843_1504 [Methylobacterium sp. ap11]|uniref:hypothetical protein n=1 Tax=Methylobacterium sp. ap11 TaxID=1761799 RepID=UPI0008C95EFD|nr:hypothetical protein [Methylobacterium sp. ap11]SEP51340.1 hypothetical protein SAMN04487843_1504 [Methylobacterium sp. ap11]
MARLLVLACSATKRPDPDCIPAIARYDGPLWRTLRATDPEGRAAKVAFLSARYGFRDAATRIVDYDARLTQDLADWMIAGGVTTRCGNLAARHPRRCRRAAASSRSGKVAASSGRQRGSDPRPFPPGGPRPIINPANRHP